MHRFPHLKLVNSSTEAGQYFRSRRSFGGSLCLEPGLFCLKISKCWWGWSSFQVAAGFSGVKRTRFVPSVDGSPSPACPNRANAGLESCEASQVKGSPFTRTPTWHCIAAVAYLYVIPSYLAFLFFFLCDNTSNLPVVPPCLVQHSVVLSRTSTHPRRNHGDFSSIWGTRCRPQE